jgi:uncharacterized protein YbjT (DUF2867 family)
VALVDFDHLDRHESLFDADAIVCALGTTMRAAGSREAFRRVDCEYPLAMARLGRRRGVAHFLLVSALGASPSSRVFYNRVKGEVERGLEELGFPSLTIVRPSLLLGDRGERRLAESIGQWVSRIAPARWRGVPAARVAAALVRSIENPPLGLRVMENAELITHASNGSPTTAHHD